MTPLFRTELTLDVTVCLHGIPVTAEVCPVHRALRLGEHPEAAVSFPGADLVVQRRGRRLWVRGRALVPGEGLTMDLGPVQVRMVADSARARMPVPAWTPDLRVLVATAAVALSVAAWDAAAHMVERSPVASAAVDRVMDRGGSTARIAAPEPSARLRLPSPEGAPEALDHERPPVVFAPGVPAPPAPAD